MTLWSHPLSRTTAPLSSSSTIHRWRSRTPVTYTCTSFHHNIYCPINRHGLHVSGRSSAAPTSYFIWPINFNAIDNNDKAWYSSTRRGRYTLHIRNSVSGPYDITLKILHSRSLSKSPIIARFAICNVPLCLPWTIFLILKVIC